MYRKITLVSLVLLGFAFSGGAGECFAGTSVKLEETGSDIISLIREGNYTQAEAQTRKLVADFSKQPDLPEALYFIAREYEWSDRYEDAEDVYQQMIENNPHSPYASTAELGVSRVDVLSLILSGKYNKAKEKTDKLLADFSDHLDLPDTLYWTARRYEWADKYEDAKSVYQRIIQGNFENSWINRAKVGFSRADILSLIISQNYDQAEDVLDQLLADFPGHPDLPDTLYWVARRYGQADRYGEQKVVYQEIIQSYPRSSYAQKAEIGIPTADILSLGMSQNSNQAQEALDELTTDFNGHPDLPETLLFIAGEYYNEAFLCEGENRDIESKEYFQMAIAACEKITTELPESAMTKHACYSAAACYYRTGQYEEALNYYKKIADDWPKYEHAWDARFMVGRCYEGLKATGAIEGSVADAQIRAAYEQVLQNYPDCKAAGYVRHQLSH